MGNGRGIEIAIGYQSIYEEEPDANDYYQNPDDVEREATSVLDNIWEAA